MFTLPGSLFDLKFVQAVLFYNIFLDTILCILYACTSSKYGL